MLQTSFCSTCGVLKPIAEFHRDRRKPHGHQESCKACRNAKDRARYRDLPTDRKRAIVDRTRRRRAECALRCLNWTRVQQLIVEAVLWDPSPPAQDIAALVDVAQIGLASKPLPRGGAPASWDAIIDIRDVIRRTEGADVACRVALAQERLDLIQHVLLSQAEAEIAWTQRRYTPKKAAWNARRNLNALHAEVRVLTREIDNLRRRATYNRAMAHLAREFYRLGVR